MRASPGGAGLPFLPLDLNPGFSGRRAPAADAVGAALQCTRRNIAHTKRKLRCILGMISPVEFMSEGKACPNFPGYAT